MHLVQILPSIVEKLLGLVVGQRKLSGQADVQYYGLEHSTVERRAVSRDKTCSSCTVLEQYLPTGRIFTHTMEVAAGNLYMTSFLCPLRFVDIPIVYGYNLVLLTY